MINSLVGLDLLPSNSKAETARIVRLIHKPQHPEPELVGKDAEGSALWRVRGVEAVRAKLRQLNADARALNLADTLGNNPPTTPISLDIYVSFAALGNEPGSGGSQHTVVLIDTPGPNEVGQRALKAQVRDHAPAGLQVHVRL